MKRFLLPLIMILVFCAESIYTDLVRFPFVSVEQAGRSAFSFACADFYVRLYQPKACGDLRFDFRISL